MIYMILALLLSGAIIWMSALVLRKAGLSELWAVTMIIPLINTAGFWVFAFARWPSVDGPLVPNPPDDGPPLPPPAPRLPSPRNKK
jgi:hypothetical protein